MLHILILMKLLWTGLIVIILSVGVFATSEEPTNVLIVELQTGSLDAAGEEFIELYNPNDAEIDMIDWLVQYKSASSEDWKTKSVLGGVIEPRGRYLMASTDYLSEEVADEFSSGFAKTGGHIRVVEPAVEEDGEDIIHDLVGWGTANTPEGDEATEAPGAGESLKRIIDEDGYFIDTDVNFEDFIISTEPTPATDDEAIIDLVEEEIINEEQPDDEEGLADESEEAEEDLVEEEAELDGVGAVLGDIVSPVVYKKVNITELFIDPVSPKTDADDEFIELFNPNKDAVQLENYVLQTGNTYSRSFTLPELKINPGQYLVLYSIDTGLPLANTGSQARLLDPNGDVVFETTKYEKAKAGNSWVLGADGKWLWSSEQTPATPNVVIVPASSSRSSSSSKSSSSKSSSSSSSSGSSDARVIYQEPASLEDTELNMAVLVGVGTMAVGYGIYEYRHDISNRINQFRKYLKARR